MILQVALFEQDSLRAIPRLPFHPGFQEERELAGVGAASPLGADGSGVFPAGREVFVATVEHGNLDVDEHHHGVGAVSLDVAHIRQGIAGCEITAIFVRVIRRRSFRVTAE